MSKNVMTATSMSLRDVERPSTVRINTDRLMRLESTIAEAAHLLPTQGPITSFVHHNTLHAFEDRPFSEAVREAGQLFGCEPYLSEDKYREALELGRIQDADLIAVLRNELGERADEPILSLCSRLQLRLAMLRHSLPAGPTSELRWFVAETDALQHFREDVSVATQDRIISDTAHWVLRDVRSVPRAPDDAGSLAEIARTKLSSVFRGFNESTIEFWDKRTWEAFTLRALWRVCQSCAHELPVATSPPRSRIRHRDVLFEATGTDIDSPVNELLIRFCAAYLDQGVATWSVPERRRGFYESFCELYRLPWACHDRRLMGLARETARLMDSGIAPLDSVLESLDQLGVPDLEWEAFLTATLLALPGWAGMILQLEARGDRVARPIPSESLIGYLAVRLVLERLALTQVASKVIGFNGPLSELREFADLLSPKSLVLSVEQRAFRLFQLAQVLGWTPQALLLLSPSECSILFREIESFSSVERRRVFHAAYERRFIVRTLDAIAIRGARKRKAVKRPRFQVVCCIDEREESFRRHIEEVAPDAETFGTAGFYGLAMFYRGVADAHFVPLCPAVITPAHWVEERSVECNSVAYRRRTAGRRIVGRLFHRIHIGSRTFAGGAILSAGAGVLATAPLVSRVLFPRLTAHLRRQFGTCIEPSAKTRLTLVRTAAEPGPEGEGLGYSLEELTDVAETVLRDLGLVCEDRMARLVLVLGHGSHSMNNPHEAAHDCGACGGAVGGPNGRAFAQIVNDARVRANLAERGLSIPNDTVFVGGLHNTCNERVTFYDTDLIPASHKDEFETIRVQIERALDNNAHERARRFDSAPLSITPADARRHMDARAEDLAQVRPEWGHATNAVTIVGRRSRTRGLFLDRRAFLTSYDPSLDDEQGSILARTLRAVVPVCAGIALEYYFSHVDPTGYGCGTKLPHNVSGLLGVVNGAASDLRTGLPWQMVEIHEPLRQLFVIEITPQILSQLLRANPAFEQLCRNDWIYLATLDPDSAAIHLFQGGEFHRYEPETNELPQVTSSAEWYRGWRDHLDYAEIIQ